MPASKEFCTEQVKRLDALNHKPTLTDGWNELVNALHAVARDDAHAKRIINEWIDSNDDCPKPRQLKELGVQMQSPETRAFTGCAQCGGTGFKTVSKSYRP